MSPGQVAASSREPSCVHEIENSPLVAHNKDGVGVHIPIRYGGYRQLVFRVCVEKSHIIYRSAGLSVTNYSTISMEFFVPNPVSSASKASGSGRHVAPSTRKAYW